MNILLDENLDWRLGQDLTAHNTSAVSMIGWAGVKNGELLRRANVQFDVLVTMDKGIYHQQNISGINLTASDFQSGYSDRSCQLSLLFTYDSFWHN